MCGCAMCPLAPAIGWFEGQDVIDVKCTKGVASRFPFTSNLDMKSDYLYLHYYTCNLQRIYLLNKMACDIIHSILDHYSAIFQQFMSLLAELKY